MEPSIRLPPPSDAQVFERLCFELYRDQWDAGTSTHHVGAVMPQAGIDVIGQFRGATIGVACRARRVTNPDLYQSVARARTVQPRLDVVILATTASRSAALHEEARRLSEASHPLQVRIDAWEDLCQMLDSAPLVRERFYGGSTSASPPAGHQASARQVFISYRREDSQATALRLRDRLAQELGADHVFLDVESVLPGQSWQHRIETELATGDTAVVLMGSQWLTATGAHGRRRLDEPGDWVRLELETALAGHIDVVPLLVDGAAIPEADALPPSLQRLASLQAGQLRNLEWEHDVEALLEVLVNNHGFTRLRGATKPGPAQSSATSVSSPTLEVGAPRPTRASSFLPLALGAGAALLPMLVVWGGWRDPTGLILASVPLLGVAFWLGERGRAVFELIESHEPAANMVAVPGGTFLMGVAAGAGRSRDERPQHPVTVQPFFLARTTMTRAEFRTVMPASAVPTEWEDREEGLLPANYVDFLTALHCCNALSRRDGLAEYYEVKGGAVKVLGGHGYRLPSEAEWEYACRAGTTTRYWSGDSETDLARVGWYDGNSKGLVHVVGEKPPNALGLHDMHGNVFEWCEDTWHRGYQNAPADGSAWVDEASVARVCRGGSFGYSARGARSALRFSAHFGRRLAGFGFRPAKSAVSR